MSKLTDNLIAYRIHKKLIVPFNQTDAFKLGIIDENGKSLKKYSELKTTKEQDAYTYLDRLVFNLKRIINRLPGGESKIKSLTSALFLIKEYMVNNEDVVLTENFCLEDSEQCVIDFLEMFEDTLTEDVTAAAVAAPTNKTGSAVSTDTPVVRKKKMRAVAVDKDTMDAARGSRKIISMMPEHVQSFSKENPETLIVLKFENSLLAIGE